MRKEWQRLNPAPKPLSEPETKKLQEQVAKWSKQSASSTTIANYFITRFTLMDRPSDMARRQFVSSFLVTMLPEGLCLLEPENSKPDERVLRSCCMAKLLPISIWQFELNNLETEIIHPDAYYNSPIPSVPRSGRHQDMVFATEFERAGLWDQAWRAYASTIYTNNAPPWAWEPVTEKTCTYISPGTAPLWVKVAECAYKAGKKDLAMDYLMKAAVFGEDDLWESIKEKALCWSIKTIPDAIQEPIDEKVKCEALTKVVRLYARLNAHPRAFQLMDEYPKAFGDSLTQLRKQTEEQWLAVVKDVSRVSTKVVYYGCEVYPKGDPLKVRIPWAFSDEAVVSVRNKLKEPISKKSMTVSSKKVETDK
jgi:hypothetical protein